MCMTCQKKKYQVLKIIDFIFEKTEFPKKNFLLDSNLVIISHVVKTGSKKQFFHLRRPENLRIREY